MKVSDHTMTILTGLVLTVVIGTLAQNSEEIMAGFTGDNIVKVENDAYTVRAGKPQLLDLLLNDKVPANTDEAAILIVDKPNCGTLNKTQGQVQFLESDSCSGEVSFTYCLAADAACTIATVELQILPHSGVGPVVASAAEAETASAPIKSPDIEIAAAPELVAAEVAPEIDPQTASASIHAGPRPCTARSL